MKIFSWKIPVLSLELCDPFWVNSAVVRKSQPFFAYRCTIALIPFLKKNSFSTEMLMHLSQRSVGHICVGLVMGFLSCSVDLCFYFCASIILFWWVQFCNVVWSQGAWFFQLLFSFSRFLRLIRVFCVSIQIKTIFFCSSSMKNTTSSLIGIAFNLLIALESVIILTLLILLV